MDATTTIYTVKTNKKEFSFNTPEEAIKCAKKFSRMLRNNTYYVYEKDYMGNEYKVFRVVNNTATDVSWQS